MSFVDFGAVKAAVSIEQAMEYLDLKMKKEGEQFRSPCPACKKGGNRALVVTPSKGAFYCFSVKKGGDQIALVAHINGTNQREAATMLQEQYCTDRTVSASTSTDTSSHSTPDPTSSRAGNSESLQPLAHLSTDHAAIEALGLSTTACDALGIGYASKGLMRGRVAFPLRLPDGTLIGYFGLATTADMAPLILLPKNLDEKCATLPKQEEKPKQPADQLRKLFRVVA
jgi:DNA primase